MLVKDCRYKVPDDMVRDFSRGSAVGKHLREQHDMQPDDIAQSFKILRKCENKFDCLKVKSLLSGGQGQPSARSMPKVKVSARSKPKVKVSARQAKVKVSARSIKVPSRVSQRST